MTYQLKITPMNDYIYAYVSGENSYENCKDGWIQLRAACKKHQIYRMLIEINMNNPLLTIDAYDHAALFKEIGIDSRYRIVCVDKKPEHYHLVRFGEDVLANRGFVTFRAFNSMEEASSWLLEA